MADEIIPFRPGGRSFELVVPERPTTETRMSWRRGLDIWLHGRLRSKETRRTYGGAVRAFFETPGVPDLADLTFEVLYAYAAALSARAEREAAPEARLAPATVNTRLAALRSFLGFARSAGWLDALLTSGQITDGLKGVKAEVHRPYQALEGEEEWTALLDAARNDTTNAPRAVALVALGLGAGLRVSELVSLNVADLARDRGGAFIDVREGKGRKDRQVPISEDVFAEVHAYLAASGRAVHKSADRATPLFLSQKRIGRTDGARLTARHARTIIDRCAERAGFPELGKRISPHALRHSYALNVLLGDPEHGREGAPVPAVTKLLGHSSATVTSRYLDHFERRNLAAYAPNLPRPKRHKKQT